MKYFLEPWPKPSPGVRRVRILLAAGVFAMVGTLAALGELPAWIRNVESSSVLEAVFFRMMSVEHHAVAFRRPPRETRPELTKLIHSQPANADLYSLRALEDEQQLDFTAAEADWKAYAAHSSDKINPQVALADFYHRRLRPADEIHTLTSIAHAGPLAAEKLTAVDEQRSWRAFERIFGVIEEQGLSKDDSIREYEAWIERYPLEPSLYSRFLAFLVAQKEFTLAGQVIASYQNRFPSDQIFPVKARAMLEYRRTSVGEGLSVYERSFEPLWDAELVRSYFDLLRETGNLRNFLDQARAALARNPEDLNSTARVFYYYQQEAKLQAAEEAITEFRQHKEAAKSAWTPEELYVCARLLEDIHFYPESARYYFALYNSPGSANAQEQAIAGLTDILLTAPEMPIRFGSGELSMYRDIGTMDQGPGYLNGILSLILNTTEPATQYSEEEQKAVGYFHRSRAAELLGLLDRRFPHSARRAELHAKLLEFYAASGESDAVVQLGREFLANFNDAPERTQVALLMADAYARRNDSTSEFAIYDSVLGELASAAQHVPLGEDTLDSAPRDPNYGSRYLQTGDGAGEDNLSSGENESAALPSRSQPAFQIAPARPSPPRGGARSPEYARVLERYLARLVQMKQIPRALSVLSGEIERNPDDPGLYERLAVFLDQNRLGAEQEEVYRRAMARFADRSWWDKLARFYLRQRRDSEFEQLTRKAVESFNGTDLEEYFKNVYRSPALYLRLNQYANQRFPHNPLFVRNLLRAYHTRETYDEAAWEALLRQHWFEGSDLRNEFFEFLSRTGRLEPELADIEQMAPDAASWENNPAAADFLAQANLWRSHFEQSAPELKSLADEYPAESELARTASSVYRSLGYFDPSATAVAARIEVNLSHFNPRDTETLARIGDIYADRDEFSEAAPYWERIPQVAPGQPGGYLEAATIYWDYFDFSNALRVLNEGRVRLNHPNLYSYEAGAIHENQRDYASAIDEYLKGALDNAGSSAEFRLLQLARRPQLRDFVDRATAQAAVLPNPPLAAVYLRVKVLEAQNRKPEMEPFLDAVVDHSTSLEQAEAIGSLAQEKSLETVRQHALEKQIALTTDPVNRLELRYSLVRLYQSHKDLQQAENQIEALYKENPKILGVVRSTVDFYWSAKKYSQAITVLIEAANAANPELKKQFTYEAARKATDARNYEQARELLTSLLASDAYNGEYLAAMADAYARAGDNRGLEQFYRDKITLFRTASLSPDARKTQISSLRRGLIPALTRNQDYSGAVDQYIELINGFPEDDAVVTEAALYAERYRRQSQLINFYSNAVAQSPRDYRWAMVLGRIYTNLENYSSAIDTYSKAVKIRPDRSDLLIARAGLDERLMRFDDAAADYERIYQLNYQDPQWMEKLAETRARQGRTTDTVAALKAALIDRRPENAVNYFEVARRLEAWGMLNQARDFAEQGALAAGADLLAEPKFLNGAKTYVRILTRLRKPEVAYSRMETALTDASATVNMVEEQVARQGITSITNQAWRARVRENRIESARRGMTSALEEMGATVNAYFTPEERLSFAAFVEAKRKPMSISDVDKFAIPLAESAALADQEARWRFEVMSAQARAPGHSYYVEMQSLMDLERHRGRFQELASELDQFAATLEKRPPGLKTPALVAAADAYRSAADQANELRVLNAISGGVGAMDTAHQQRFFELALADDPEELVRIAGQWTFPGQQAADYLVAHGSADLAHAVVEARSGVRPPVWNQAYNALVGLYFSERTPQVTSAFSAVLGARTIGDRLRTKADRSQELAGATWFYYGSCYGEYLDATKQEGGEDYIPAMLEESPATAANYLAMAEYYASVGDTKAAIRDYEHTLELAPSRPDVYDSLAMAYLKQGDPSTALAEWKRAFRELSKQLDSARVPETFWSDFGRTADQLGSHHLFFELKPDAETILRTYLHRNGNWRSNALLKPAYLAIHNPASATAWLIDLSSSAADPAQILVDLVDVSWIPLEQREPIYQRIVELKQETATKLEGAERDAAQQDLAEWQVRAIRYLVRTKQYAKAADQISALPRETREFHASALVVLELEVAGRLGTLDAKLAAYRDTPEEAPASNLLRTAAHDISEAGDTPSARKILEFVFAREIDNHQLTASNFLGLAEIRIASGDTAGAVDLLDRLVLVVGNPFENLEPAAALLENTGHNREAVEFLDQLVKSAPWNASYRLRFEKAKIAAGEDLGPAEEALATIASTPANAYGLRSQAATALLGHSHTDLGSGELNLLAETPSSIPGASADKFYYYEARIRAARNASDANSKIELLRHAMIDFPRRDQARIPLFQAALRSHADEFALGVIDPLLNTRFWAGKQPTEADETGSDSSEEETDSNLPLAFSRVLSRAERAQLAGAIGETMVRLNRPADAVGYFELARHSETAPARRKTLDRRIAELKAELRVQAQNTARQPILHEALEQDRTVRPKLSARVVPTREASITKGGAQ